MQTKKLLYAAVGAPIVAARTAQARAVELRHKLSEGAESLGKDLESQLEEWAQEGEDLLGRLGDSKAFDELGERMDLDQVQEQVSKLREQIEDLLDTWRSNFRPDKAAPVTHIPVEETPPATPEAPAAKKPAAKKPATTRPAAKKPAAKKPAAKKPAAKKAPAAKTAAEKAASGSAGNGGSDRDAQAS